MASIPLPALHVNPPPDPSEGIQKAIQLRSLMQGQQLQQQQIQAAQLENQKRQQAVKDQQTLLGLYQKHQGDLDKVVQDAPNAGVSPEATQQLQLHAIAVKTQTQDLVAKQGAEAARQADLLVGSHETVDKAPAEQKPAIYQQELASLQKQNVDVSQLPPEYPGDEKFKLLGIVARGHSKNVEDALKQQQAAEAQAKAGEATAQTNKINAEINPNNPSDPNIRKQKYEGILQKLQQEGPGGVTPNDMNFAKSFEFGQRKTTTQSDSLGVTSVNTNTPSGISAAIAAYRGGAAPQGGGGTASPAGPSGAPRPASTPIPNTPSAKDSLVDMIGQYKLNPMMMSRMMTKHPEVIAAVNAKYPDFNQANYNAANKAITDLAPSGKTGQQITSYNTFLRHAGALYDAVDSLDNSKYSDLLNKPVNWLAQHTGDARVADFMAAMQPPMKEFQSFLLNNHAMHDEDVKDAHSLIDVNKTPQEIRAVLKRFAETGSARLSEQNESFKRVTGRDIPDLVSPQAAAAYNKITAGGGKAGLQIGQQVTLKNGKTVTVTAVHPDGSFDAK